MTTTTATKKLAPLGLVLRSMRAMAGVTQQAHAGAVGLGQGYLSKMENGEKRASYERLVELLTALEAGQVDRQGIVQARLAVLHGEGVLSEEELAALVAFHGCRPVICLYARHETYGERLPACPSCGEQLVCRPDGHRCPNGCEVAP